MSLNEFINYNWLDLSRNYNNRNLADTFQHFCECVYTGMKNKYVWLPKEYTRNIIIKEINR